MYTPKCLGIPTDSTKKFFHFYLGCLEMTSTGLFLPLYNESCTTLKNKQSCEYKGEKHIDIFSTNDQWRLDTSGRTSTLGSKIIAHYIFALGLAGSGAWLSDVNFFSKIWVYFGWPWNGYCWYIL
jgi:hypothetical protein